MKNCYYIMVLAALVAALAAACTPAAPPQTPAGIPAKQTASAVPATSQQQQWEAVVAEAKKEGTVAVYTIWRPETRTGVTQAFRDKYGINVEMSPFGRGAELLAKVQAEQRAGLFTADVFGAGGATLISSMKPAGVMASIEPLLMLPEAMDPKFWSGGRFPFMDKDKTSIGMIAFLNRYIMYNTDLIKKGELTGYQDLLKPQYKGKIAINDPSMSGMGNAMMGHLSMDIWNVEQAKNYLTQLIKQQGAVIERDNRLHMEWAARGKYPIGLAPNDLADFLKVGAPLDAVIEPDGTFVTPAAGAIAVPPRLAHPNAARVFINWLLTKEGATVFSKGFGNPSLRNDVSTEGFAQAVLPQPGEKLFMDSEEAIIFRGQLLAVAKQVIEEANK